MIDFIFHFLMHHPEFTIVGAITLIQVAPIKIDPWTHLAKWFKKILIGDVDKKLDDISTKVRTLDEQIKESEAKSARTHILRFADELYTRQVKHSKDYFDDILDDIKDYEMYCDTHKKFKNGKTGMAVELIKKTYTELYDDHEFL